MKIQGNSLKKGDQFKLGDDSSVYTFINTTKNKRFGFQELNAKNDWDEFCSFRVDTMESNNLIINIL